MITCPRCSAKMSSHLPFFTFSGYNGMIRCVCPSCGNQSALSPEYPDRVYPREWLPFAQEVASTWAIQTALQELVDDGLIKWSDLTAPDTATDLLRDVMCDHANCECQPSPVHGGDVRQDRGGYMIHNEDDPFTIARLIAASTPAGKRRAFRDACLQLKHAILADLEPLLLHIIRILNSLRGRKR